MGALIRQVHAATRFDKSDVADFSLLYDVLQLLPARVKVELVIYRDFGFCGCRKVFDRTPILSLNCDGFFHEDSGYSGVFRGFEYFQSHTWRGIYVYQVWLFFFKHFPIVQIPYIDVKRIAKYVQVFFCSRGDCGEFAACYVLIRFCQSPRSPATYADYCTFKH